MKMVEEIVTDYLRAMDPDDRRRFYREFESYCETGHKEIISLFYRFLPPPPKKLIVKWGASMFADYCKKFDAG